MTSWYTLPAARDWTCPPSPGDAHAFHQSLPGYSPTPLVPVPELAAELGVGRLLVKDESSRLGLPAFKVLGASWACRQVLQRHPGAMLVTATDGNHGRAVARMAAHFGVRATVFVPVVMLPQTAARIAAEAAKVVWVGGDYSDAVRCAAAFAADQPGRALVQDTAWAGYEQVPAWIVQGYQTLLDEVDTQLGSAPDLVAVPVGVGSLAEAAVRHYRPPRATHPSVLSVEPDTAACVLASLISGGTGESTIPDRCVFTVERRTLPGETLEHVEADIAALIDRCRPADPRLTVNARTVLHRPPMETPPTAPIVQALVAAAGPGTSVAPMSYWADSAFLAAAGIPTVLYGPEGEGAHADTEWVSRAGTITATTVLTQLAQDFCS